MKDYDQIVRKYARDLASVPTIDDAYLSTFFKNGEFSKLSLPNEQLLDLEGLLGRMTSASYMPSPSDENQFALLRQDVPRLFKTYERLGKVRILYDTTFILRRFQANLSKYAVIGQRSRGCKLLEGIGSVGALP